MHVVDIWTHFSLQEQQHKRSGVICRGCYFHKQNDATAFDHKRTSKVLYQGRCLRRGAGKWWNPKRRMWRIWCGLQTFTTMLKPRNTQEAIGGPYKHWIVWVWQRRFITKLPVLNLWDHVLKQNFVAWQDLGQFSNHHTLIKDISWWRRW